MEELWAADRATGQGVDTARQVRRRIESQSFNVNLNEEHMEYVPEPPTFYQETEEAFPSGGFLQSSSHLFDTICTFCCKLIIAGIKKKSPHGGLDGCSISDTDDKPKRSH